MKTDETLLRKIAPSLSSKHKRKATQDYILSEMSKNINELFDQFEVNTIRRKTYFLAQTCHESAGFSTTEEFASGKAYEGRKDLGNTQPGDGVRFKGHGLIQTTGRYNHSQFTIWCRKHYPDCPDFVEEPKKLTEFPWAMLSAFYYWQSRDLNKWADAGDFRRVTRIINGGYNGLEDRRRYLARAEDAYAIDNKPKLLRLGVEGADVVELQTRLNALNYNVGKADGNFGPLTEAGVRNFQAAHFLVIDGKVRVGGETWQALGEALENNNSRIISEERAKAKGSDLPNSRIVKSSDEGTGATVVTGVLGTLMMYWDQAQEFVSQWIVPENLLFIGSAALNVYLVTRLIKARNARIDDHRRGKTL